MGKRKKHWKLWKTKRFKRIKMKILVMIVPRMFYWITQVLFRTCRIRLIGKENEDQFIRQGHPILFVSWHQGLLYYVFHFRNRNGIVMASKSEDGDIIASILKLYGFQDAPRGSSSHGGHSALHDMILRIKETHSSGGLVADAPRGPFGVAKMGIIKLAKETGLPLIPVMWWPKKGIMFSSWDKTLLPFPFTDIVFYYAPPIFIAADSTKEAMEEARIALGEKLNEMHEEARTYFVK